jgi:glycerophosphoryl diester phosphodiesterase
MVEIKISPMQKMIHARKLIFMAIFALFLIGCTSTKYLDRSSNVQSVTEQLRNPNKNTVLISAHRGDWRNAPENSLQGLENCIKMGVDIVEFDLRKTKDGHLIVLHDETLDRTTTGKGKAIDYTLAEVRQLKLKDGAGHTTMHFIPTLEEFLMASKGRVVVCIDKGFGYIGQAMKTVSQMNMSDQIIYNIPAMSPDSLKSLNIPEMDDKVLLNLLSFPSDTIKAQRFVKAYTVRKNVIMHPTFADDTAPLVKWMPMVKHSGMHLWLNALWPEHNGGHDDNRAVDRGEMEESWGWLIDHGATIIQTDRPQALLKYLRNKGFRKNIEK